MNWRMRVLQTLALPLGHGTIWKSGTRGYVPDFWSGRRGSTSLPPPWQGGALPDELRPQTWCLRSESNQRHADFQSAALPTELQRHMRKGTSSFAQICDFMATPNGLEPSTSSVTGWRANRLHHRAKYGGNNRARTCDLLLVRQMLSQLSYAPIFASGFAHLSDVVYYTQVEPFCQALFSIFYFEFFGSVIFAYFCQKPSRRHF